MHLKRYRGNTVSEALAHVRADLGPNALVLSTRMVSERGWRGWIGQRVVEVTAAPDRDMSESRPKAAKVRQPARPPAPQETAAEPVATDSGLDAIAARLVAAGLDRRLASDVATRIPADRRRQVSEQQLRRAIADVLEGLAAAGDGLARAEAFVGPPGAGKTTTIAKIAAQWRVRAGQRVGLVSADDYRVGAVDQLRLYADIIGLPFVATFSTEELEAVLDRIETGTVLVDTAGRGRRDRELRELLTLLGSHPRVRTHLVLSATTSPRDATRWLQVYERASPARIVLTRLDEAESIGPLIGLLRERRLPVSFLGTGQRVPDDLVRANATLLTAHVLGDAPGQNGDLA
jgi:flagellar biosynthesis protein FlhF